MLMIFQIVIQISEQMQRLHDHDLSDSYSDFRADAGITCQDLSDTYSDFRADASITLSRSFR